MGANWDEVPWGFAIFLSIFAVVLFYFIFFQGYLSAAIYKCILRCVLRNKLNISFKRIQFSVLSGHVAIHNLVITTSSMQIKIYRFCVALKYWSKIPEFGENENERNIDYNINEQLKRIEEEEEEENEEESPKGKKSKKKKKSKRKNRLIDVLFNRKSRFLVNIDGLDVCLFNQSNDAIARIEAFRELFAKQGKTTEEATSYFKEMYGSPPPKPYQMSVWMRLILPMRFQINALRVSVGNPNLPAILYIVGHKVRGLYTMLPREDPQHSMKKCIIAKVTKLQIQSVPNKQFDKSKINRTLPMRNIDQRFDIKRNVVYVEETNVNFTQDAVGCYIRSEDSRKALLVSAEPKMIVNVDLRGALIEYGPYFDKVRSAFMRYFAPFLFTNPLVYPDSTNRVKYMEIFVKLKGPEPTIITVPFVTTQGLDESVNVTVDSNSEINLSLPRFVSKVEERKTEIECKFQNPIISTSLPETKTGDSAIITADSLLVSMLTVPGEAWYDVSDIKLSLNFLNAVTKLAPYHMLFLAQLGSDFYSRYPFAELIDEPIYFRPNNFYLIVGMYPSVFKFLTKPLPEFELINEVDHHQRMEISSEAFIARVHIPTLIWHEVNREVFFSAQFKNPKLEFLYPPNHVYQFRRNCFKKAFEKNQPGVNYIDHEYVKVDSIEVSGSFRWSRADGCMQLPMVVKIGEAEGLFTVLAITSVISLIVNYMSGEKKHPNTLRHNQAFERWKPPPLAFPDRVVHSQVNIQFTHTTVKMPFDLYDTSAYAVGHIKDLYLSIEARYPFYHLILSCDSFKGTLERTNFPNENYYFERLANGSQDRDQQGIVHVDGIRFTQKSVTVRHPRIAHVHRILGLDLGDITGYATFHQVFAFIDLAVNITNLWLTMDTKPYPQPNLDLIYLPFQYISFFRRATIFVDFLQNGLMVVRLPGGVSMYQDNLINNDSHVAYYLDIPAIDVHHIVAENEKQKIRKKVESDGNIQLTELDNGDDDEEEEIISSTSSIRDSSENVKLKCIMHFSTHFQFIKTIRYEESHYDSVRQMQTINELNAMHYFDFDKLPQKCDFPNISKHYDVNLNEEYNLSQTFVMDPDHDNQFDLPLPTIQFTHQEQYCDDDTAEYWLHVFGWQRFAQHHLSTEKVTIADESLERFNRRHYDMHTIVPDKTVVVMEVEFLQTLMIILKIINLQPDSHYLAKIARLLTVQSATPKFAKYKNMSVNVPELVVNIVDSHRLVNCMFTMKSLDLVNFYEVNKSKKMTLAVQEIEFKIFNNGKEDNPPISMKLPLIDLGKVDGDMSIQFDKTTVHIPSIPPAVKIINYLMEHFVPAFRKVESPGIGVGAKDFQRLLRMRKDFQINVDWILHRQYITCITDPSQMIKNELQYIDNEEIHYENQEQAKTNDTDEEDPERAKITFVSDRENAIISAFYQVYVNSGMNNFVNTYPFYISENKDDELDESEVVINPNEDTLGLPIPVHSRKIFKLGKIQFMVENNSVAIRLKPISMKTDENISTASIVIKYIKTDLHANLLTFITDIKKPPKAKKIPASKALKIQEEKNAKKIAKNDKNKNKQFILHFIMTNFQVQFEYIYLGIKSISALCHFSKEASIICSLNELLVRIDQYAQIVLGGFDFSFSHLKHCSYFYLRPIEVKFTIDLFLNPKSCIDLDLFKIKKKQPKIKPKLNMKEKTEKIINAVNKAKDTKTGGFLSKWLAENDFVVSIGSICIQAAIDDNSMAMVELPGLRGGIISTNNDLIAYYLYVICPQITISNIITLPLTGVLIHGHYKPSNNDIEMFTVTDELLIQAHKSTLVQLAQLTNNLLSKIPPKVKPIESKVENVSQRKSVDEISESAKISMNISLAIPKILLELPEISSSLRIIEPSAMIKSKDGLEFTAKISDLRLNIDNTEISISMHAEKTKDQILFETNGLHITITPHLFNELTNLKDFFMTIKNEIVQQEKVSQVVTGVQTSLKNTVSKNAAEFIAKNLKPDSSLKRARSNSFDTSEELTEYEIPTLPGLKFVLILNDNLINIQLPLFDENSEVDESKKIQGFILRMLEIKLQMETRKSNKHTKIASATQFSILDFEITFDTNERELCNNKSKESESKLSMIQMKKAMMSTLHFVNEFNVMGDIDGFTVILYPTIPTAVSHILQFVKCVQKASLEMKNGKKQHSPSNERRNSLKQFTQTIYQTTTLQLIIENTSILLNPIKTKLPIPTVSIYADMKKKNAIFSEQNIQAMVRLYQIKAPITPLVTKWATRLIKYIKRVKDAQAMKMQLQSTPALIKKKKAKVKNSLIKRKIAATIILDSIEFSVGCQPSDVQLVFGFEGFAAHLTSLSNGVSLQLNRLFISTDKISTYQNGLIPPEKATDEYQYEQRRLLAFEIPVINGFISKESIVFNVQTIDLVVSNDKIEDLFTFLTVWIQPFMKIAPTTSSQAKNMPLSGVPTSTESLLDESSEIVQSEVATSQLTISSKVSAINITFMYSGVNGKLKLEIAPTYFYKDSESLFMAISQIKLTASGFVEGTMHFDPIMIIKSYLVDTIQPVVNTGVDSNTNQNALVPKTQDFEDWGRFSFVAMLGQIHCNITSYEDPMLFFDLGGASLFFLFAPPSDQILSITIDSPQLRMISQAVQKFKSLVKSIVEPIKNGIKKTQISQIPHDGTEPHKSKKKKKKKKIPIKKARLDFLFESFQVELFRYYLTDKEAVRVRLDGVSLSIQLVEKGLKLNIVQVADPNRRTKRNMSFIFQPMALSRLFCDGGTVNSERNVLYIPKFSGELNSIQNVLDVRYDFITTFDNSVDTSLSISDYEAVMAIVKFALSQIKNKTNSSESNSTTALHGKADNNNEEEESYEEEEEDNFDDDFDRKKKKKKKKKPKPKIKFNFIPGIYEFAPPFKMSLGARIKPDVDWVLARFGITDEHIIPNTLFQYVCLGLQRILDSLAQSVSSKEKEPELR